MQALRPILIAKAAEKIAQIAALTTTHEHLIRFLMSVLTKLTTISITSAHVILTEANAHRLSLSTASCHIKLMAELKVLDPAAQCPSLTEGNWTKIKQIGSIRSDQHGASNMAFVR